MDNNPNIKTNPNHDFFPSCNVKFQAKEEYFRKFPFLTGLHLTYLPTGIPHQERFDENNLPVIIDPPPLVKPLTIKQKAVTTKFRNVVITVNDPPERVLNYYENGWKTLPDAFQFFCYSIERGGNSARIHLQGKFFN